MPRLTRKQVFVLLTLAVCCLAVTLWLGLRYHDALENSSRTRACEEWEKAEAAGQGLGWDLTYMSALKRMGLCPGYPFCGEWAKPEPPIHKHFAEWQGDPITSSMEIELPDGHAGMAIMWLIRTKDNAYYWSYHTSNLDNTGMKMPIEAQHYDSAFGTMTCWRQGEPSNKIFGPKGYIGFLSMYKDGRSRQMLLTYDDLFEGDSDPDEGKPGGVLGSYDAAGAFGSRGPKEACSGSKIMVSHTSASCLLAVTSWTLLSGVLHHPFVDVVIKQMPDNM